MNTLWGTVDVSSSRLTDSRAANRRKSTINNGCGMAFRGEANGYVRRGVAVPRVSAEDGRPDTDSADGALTSRTDGSAHAIEG